MDKEYKYMSFLGLGSIFLAINLGTGDLMFGFFGVLFLVLGSIQLIGN